MKRNKVNNFKLVLALAIVALVAIFLCQGNFLIDICARVIANADSFSYEPTYSQAVENTSEASIAYNSFKYVNANAEEISSLTMEYNGQENIIEAVIEGTVNEVEYYWYKQNVNSNNFEKISQTSNPQLAVKDYSQSGTYKCIVNEIGQTETLELNTIEVNINKKEISILQLKTAQSSKYYDGTNAVEVEATISGNVDGDDVYVKVDATTQTPNVDKGKLVTVNSVSLQGEDAENYVLNQTLPNTTLDIEILPKDAELVWETIDNKKSFVYNSESQLTKINLYYININGEKVRLGFSITGSNTFGTAQHYVNEFKNCGTYQAVAILTPNEHNYNLQDTTGDTTINLSITRATPEITISNTVFTYNGEVQDACRCAILNNAEQDLIFSNNKFTTVSEGNGRAVTVRAEQSLNYFAISQQYTITVLKAEANIDISNVKTDYVYTGVQQTISSGATIDNEEQTLAYSNNKFTTVSQGNGKKITVYAVETENYYYTSKTFTINVDKAKVDTSDWYWDYSKELTYTGAAQTIHLYGPNTAYVQVKPEGNKQTNAGTYTASATFVVSENYYPVSFPSITWKINKASVTKPNCLPRVTIYNGETQTLDFPKDTKYVISNNEKTNAGTYEVNISLLNNSNMQWSDGSSDNLTVKWIIEKAVVAAPNTGLRFNYTGKQQTLTFENDNLFTILDGTATEVGQYTSYLVLKDAENYKWENTSSPYITYNWKIVEGESSANVPVIAIIISCITLALLATYATLHSTMIIKRKRRARLLLKAREYRAAELKELKKKEIKQIETLTVDPEVEIKPKEQKVEVKKEPAKRLAQTVSRPVTREALAAKKAVKEEEKVEQKTKLEEEKIEVKETVKTAKKSTSKTKKSSTVGKAKTKKVAAKKPTKKTTAKKKTTTKKTTTKKTTKGKV